MILAKRCVIHAKIGKSCIGSRRGGVAKWRIFVAPINKYTDRTSARLLNSGGGPGPGPPKVAGDQLLVDGLEKLDASQDLRSAGNTKVAQSDLNHPKLRNLNIASLTEASRGQGQPFRPSCSTELLQTDPPRRGERGSSPACVMEVRRKERSESLDSGGKRLTP